MIFRKSIAPQVAKKMESSGSRVDKQNGVKRYGKN